MTIHDTHPFADPDPDPVRRLRGRLGGRVSAWTAGRGTSRAGWTVSSLLVVAGEPARVLGVLDPDSDLVAGLESDARVAVQLLQWQHRDLAEVLAGLAPSPGGPFRWGRWRDTDWGPVVDGVTTWAGVRVEDLRPVGWSVLAEGVLEHVEAGEEKEPLYHRRGRYVRG